MLENLTKDSLFIDIGSNIGFYALYACRLVKQENIYAFEPNKEIFKILTENLRLNGLKEVNAYNCGISNKNGKEKLYYNLENSGGGSFNRSWFPFHYEVDIVRFDDFIDLNYDNYSTYFIKVDTEGHDLKVLQSMEKLLVAKKDKIVVTEVRKNTLMDILSLLDNYGLYPIEMEDGGTWQVLSSINQQSLLEDLTRRNGPADLTFVSKYNTFLHAPSLSDGND